MTSVGEAKTTAYVHELTTRFGDDIELEVPFAIATTEAVPNLLGRLGVFDELQIDFDPSLLETSLRRRWLNENHTRMWRFLSDTAKHIGERYELETLPHPADSVVASFLRRADELILGVSGLAKLHRPYAGPMFIRALFELALQFEYLMEDPQRHAQLHCDFEHVARYKYHQQRLRDPAGPIVRLLASSPQRPAGERRIKTLYDQVRGRFAKGKTNKIWDNWYCMTVFELAARAGWEGEYNLWYRRGCVWAHADPLGMDPSLALPPDTTLLVCYHYYARMLLRLADHTSVVLTAEQYEFLTKLTQELS